MSKKNRIEPVGVPWMVSPSVSALRIVICEDGDATVTFDAAIISQGGDDLGELLNKRVEVRFSSGQWARVAPAHSDTCTLPPEEFDTSSIDSLVATDVNMSDYLINFRDRWSKSGNCPDPRIYQVQDSEWLVSSRAHRFGCKHYVLNGRDMWVEVLCIDMTWAWADVPAG